MTHSIATITSNPRSHRSSTNQTGMVSIMVTMIMMLVISLIVLGFAQISRRESRQSLDRQLSSQAFFAAESGVNDARKEIMDRVAAGQPVVDKTECETRSTDTNYGFEPKIADGVSYSCLLINTKLTNIRHELTAGEHSVVVPIEPDGGPITDMHIKWEAKPAATSVATCAAAVPASGNFSKSSGNAWTCPYGVLRMDMVRTDASELNRATATANQKTVFLYPIRNGGGAPSSQNHNNIDGTVTPMKCTTTSCDIDIRGMPGGGARNYALRLSAMYASGSVEISAKQGANSLKLASAQAQIDVTGKAQDVLRRIQVRLALTPSNSSPDFPLESASSICKRFSIADKYFEIPSDIQGQDDNNPMCRQLRVRP